MEALVTVLLIIFIAGFFLRHFGKYLLRFFLWRMAKRFGANSNAFDQNRRSRKAARQEQPAPEQIIPNNVGEYVDYEEVKKENGL
ncbi:MAG: DUF4834 family protein [Prevotellaceae bacterium]|nr:DUF4834 family protein [Prevotellaceae bacterium]